MAAEGTSVTLTCGVSNAVGVWNVSYSWEQVGWGTVGRGHVLEFAATAETEGAYRCIASLPTQSDYPVINVSLSITVKIPSM